MRNGCYSTNRDAVAIINELIGRLNEFSEQCNAAQAQGGGMQLDETKFQVCKPIYFLGLERFISLFEIVVHQLISNEGHDPNLPINNNR